MPPDTQTGTASGSSAVSEATMRLLRFFQYDHLPQNLQHVSKEFHNLAHWIVGELPESAERTVALRKLLEGKDAAVRTLLP
jgi:NAD(P)H-dependent FMN reductase